MWEALGGPSACESPSPWAGESNKNALERTSWLLPVRSRFHAHRALCSGVDLESTRNQFGFTMGFDVMKVQATALRSALFDLLWLSAVHDRALQGQRACYCR